MASETIISAPATRPSSTSTFEVQALEQQHAGDGAGHAAEGQPLGDAEVDGALAQVPPAADGLRHRAVGEVGPDRHDRVDPDDEDQQRRHERAAADAGQPDEDPDAEAEEDDERVHQTCSPHSVFVAARPAALAARAGRRARRAADRGVALVVQRVVRKVALVDPPPEVLLGPLDQRVELPHRALLVPLDGLGVGARRRLLAADARDPRVLAGERRLERGDLGLAAAVGGGPRRPRASETSTLTPKRSSKARQVASVSGNSTPVSIVTMRASGAIRTSSSIRTDSSFWKEHSSTRLG